MSSIVYSKRSQVPRFGKWLRELREQKGLPLRAVAAAADMDQASLSKAELGQRLLTEEQTALLAKFFGVDGKEAEGRRLAEKFRHETESNPGAARHALYILAEQAGIYGGQRKKSGLRAGGGVR